VVYGFLAFLVSLVFALPTGTLEERKQRLFATVPEVHIFYYLWFGNPQKDGDYKHWNHEELPHWKPEVRDRHSPGVKFHPPHNIHAAYYPQRGCYSSKDPRLLNAHMHELADIGVTAIVVNWWGRPYVDIPDDELHEPDVSTDELMPLVLDAAQKHGIEVAIHLEPYEGRSLETIRWDIDYILDKYGDHPALYRRRKKIDRTNTEPIPLFYVYDTHLTAHKREWGVLLKPGRAGIRGKKHDALFMSLWLKRRGGYLAQDGGFDGFYTYFASKGFSFGSTLVNWPKLNKYGRNHKLVFAPTVGPGYNDTGIRPWNDYHSQSRMEGEYLDSFFQAAIKWGTNIITVNSYNDWGHGTQFESATPKKVRNSDGELVRQYEDYEPFAPDFYVKRLKHWIKQFQKLRGYKEEL